MNNEEQKSADKHNKEIILSFETKIDNNNSLKISENEFEVLLNKIKEIQGLPEEVVINFLNSKGKIKNKNVAKNLSY